MRCVATWSHRSYCAGMHGQPRGTVLATGYSTLQLCSFHRGIVEYEPVIEPWPLRLSMSQSTFDVCPPDNPSQRERRTAQSLVLHSDEVLCFTLARPVIDALRTTLQAWTAAELASAQDSGDTSVVPYPNETRGMNSVGGLPASARMSLLRRSSRSTSFSSNAVMSHAVGAQYVFVNHAGADCAVRILGHRSRCYEVLSVANGESVRAPWRCPLHGVGINRTHGLLRIPCRFILPGRVAGGW